MDNDQIARLKQHAKELRELAALISNEVHRKLLLESAVEFENLATTIIRRLMSGD
jgi:hypothetical protein